MSAVTDPDRIEIDRTVDLDEYEAIKFKYSSGQKTHAVAAFGTRTLCGLGNLNYAECMWQRWALELDHCRRCERVIAAKEGLS